MKKYTFSIVNITKNVGFVLIFLMCSLSFGQASITSGTAVTDALTSYVGTTATTPANWTLVATGGTTIGNGTNQSTGTAGGWYGNANMSFLGSGSASNANATWLLQNNSGTTLSGFTLSFTARMWRSGTASPSVTVSYSNSATITNPASGALANALTNLTFNDATANINTGATMSQTVTGLSISSGQYIFIRFIHPGGSSSDNLGWDDLSFTPTLASSSPTVNGTIATNEYGTHTNGSNQDTNTITWFNTWDATNLYLGIGAASNNSTEAAVVYIDVNPIVPVNGGTNTNGTNIGFAYDRSTVNPAFRADYVLYFKSGYYELRSANGSGGWSSSPVTSGLTYAQSGAGASQSQEIAIPWSVLGGSLPATFNWSAYKVYDGGASNNGVYGQIPANNPGGAQNVTAYTLAANRYYTVSSTTSGSSTLPFSRISYCQPIGVTSNGFGAASFWDFTVNPGSGFQVARSNSGGDWTISGNLVVGSGILYFGSGGSGYGASTIANVNVVGGTFSMDQTNKIMNVSGNLSIASGATLAMSGTAGGDISIAGNWSNSGTFNCSGRQVVFSGSAAQTLSGTNTYDFLKLNNSAGVTLQGSSPVTINTNLDLTAGKLTLGANNLTLLQAATATNASATSYVVTNSTGALVKNSVGNNATSFPVGLATSYTPLSVTNTGTSNTLSLVVTSPPANTVSDATKIVNLEWNLNSAGSGAVATIAFNWNTANQGSSYSTTGTGEMGNYTNGPNYAITSIGTMAAQSKTVTGVALSSGNNKLVLGNTGAVFATPPSNDDCSGATAITLDATAITGNILNATTSLAATCAGTANDDVWYSFTTGLAGTYTITVVGSTSFDPVVDVRSGTCNGTNIFCADATASAGTETVSATGLSANTTYYVRVYDYGSGVPGSTTFTIAVAAPPATLSNSTSSLAFGNQAPITQSASQTFNLSGSNLSGAPGVITVTAPNTDFQVSNDNTTWGSTATVSYTTQTLASTAVYVRFTPQSSGSKSGNLTFSGGGTSNNPTIALIGTGVLPAPTATAATNIAATSFSANWNAVTGASSGYLLDVSTSATFGTSGVAINEGFEGSTFPPSGWITTSWVRSTTSGDFLNGVAAAIATSNTGTLTTSSVAYPTNLTFYLGRSSNTTAKTLSIEVSTTSQSTGFTTIATYDHTNVPAGSYSQYSVDLSAFSGYQNVYIRFNKNSTTTSPWRLDDVIINQYIPSFVSGYNAKPISGQATISSSVTGLSADTTYYYRVSATDGTPSAYSNVITVYPASRGGSVSSDQTVCSGSQPATLTLSGNNGSIIKWQKSSDAAFTSPTDIANTTATLTGSQVGNITSTTYVRAVVQSYSNPTANSSYATISLSAEPTYANLQYPASGTICQTGTFNAYGQIYQAGVTDPAGSSSAITAQFGYSTSNSDPSTWTDWSVATFNAQYGNNDEYTYAFNPPSSGTYYYTFRYRKDACSWQYGGYSFIGGGYWNGTTNVSGVLNVNSASASGTASAANSSLCSGSSTTLSLSGNTGTIQWQQSLNGTSGWTNVTGGSGATTSSYTTPNLTVTTYYRAVVTSGVCSAANSNAVTVAVNPLPTITLSYIDDVLPTDTSFSIPFTATSGSPDQYSIVTSTVGGGASTIMMPNFTAVTNASLGSSPISVTIPASSAAEYGFVLTVTNSTTGCSKDYPFQFHVTSVGHGVIGTNQTICSGATPAPLTSVTDGSSTFGSITYTWEQSTTSFNTGYTTISGETGAGYSPGALTQTTYYKRVTHYTGTNPDVASDSDPVTITVNASVGGTVGGSTSICSGATSGVLTLSGHSGSVVRWESAVSPFTNWTTISNTATTYTSGALTETTKFRAVVNNNSCGEATASPATITISTTTYDGTSWSNGDPDSTKAAIFTGNYTIAADFTACSLRVTNNAVVSVSSNYNVNLNGAITVDSGSSFTLNNNSNLLQSDATAVNTGNIIVKRNTSNIVRLDHTLWSSPVTGQNLFSFSPNTLVNRFYVYNTATNSYVTTGLSNTSLFTPVKGFAVRAPNNQSATTPAQWTGTFTGVPNNGTKTFTLATDAANGYHYNLVGNPYPSTISASDFYAANSSVIGGTLYFYAHTLTMNSSGLFPTGTNYATWTGLGGTAATAGDGHTPAVAPNGIIQVGQGFIVKATAAGAVSFTNAMRVANQQNQFMKAATTTPETHRMWLNLKTDTGVDVNQILVGYMDGATQGVDAGLDGLSFGNTGSYLYSKIDNNNYVIQARSLPFDTTDEVPLGFNCATAGSYSISLTNTDGLFAGSQDILVRDNLTGTDTSIKTAPYTFTSEAGVFDSRFKLVYQQALGVPSTNFTENSVIVYKNTDWFHVTTKGIEMKDIMVYDISGRLIYSQKDINATTAVLNGLSTANQVLLLKITSQEGKVVTIKVIN